MLAYIIRRVLLAIPVMFVVATGVFLLLFLTPGDPVSVILGPDASPQRVDELRQQLGRQLARRGVSQALEKAGIQPGDKVRCGNFEWEW